MNLGLHILQIAYWLAVATWFGGVLFIALSAPVIFRTVREANPSLPKVRSATLEGQHGSLLAGGIVANLLALLGRMQILCAAVLLVVLGAQWFIINIDVPHRLIAAIVRCALYAACLVLFVYDRRVLWPKIWTHRQQYIEHADEPEIANPAKEQFDHYHRESVTLMSISLFLLMGMILFGVFT